MRILSLFCLVLLSCTSGAKKEAVVLAPLKTMIPSGYVPADVKLLTKEGENIEGYFSPDGTRVLFRSEKRAQHQHPQIYEMELIYYKERRLTFHDGEDTCAFYHPRDGKFFYSSTTDEIKEEKQLDKKTAQIAPLVSTDVGDLSGELPPFEIYESGLNGTNIERITNSEGYDSEVSVHPSGGSIIFSSGRTGDIELHSLDLKTRGVKRITSEPGPDGGAFFSPKGRQIVWRHFNPEMTVSHIMIASQWGGERKALTTKKAVHWAPYWHPSGKEIIFSSNRDEAQNFELYVVDVKGLCLKRLTYSVGSDTNPSFNPDGTKVIFTSNRSGQNQLYVMDYKPPESCADELP
jgi:Tol biopolymer transport system component